MYVYSVHQLEAATFALHPHLSPHTQLHTYIFDNMCVMYLYVYPASIANRDLLLRDGTKGCGENCI